MKTSTVSKNYTNLTKGLKIHFITPAVVYNLNKPILTEIFIFPSLVSDLNPKTAG